MIWKKCKGLDTDALFWFLRWSHTRESILLYSWNAQIGRDLDRPLKSDRWDWPQMNSQAQVRVCVHALNPLLILLMGYKWHYLKWGQSKSLECHRPFVKHHLDQAMQQSYFPMIPQSLIRSARGRRSGSSRSANCWVHQAQNGGLTSPRQGRSGSLPHHNSGTQLFTPRSTTYNRILRWPWHHPVSTWGLGRGRPQSLKASIIFTPFHRWELTIWTI